MAQASELVTAVEDRSDELHEWYAEDEPDGATVLDDLLATFKRYVALPDHHSAVAVTLWTAVTHALPAFEFAPRLVATSPQKRCGKTRLLDLITGTCHAPLATVDATVAAIFRSLGGDHPRTLIIDEADTKFGNKKVAEQNEELRALLNAGHQRGRPALRCVGPMQIPTEFDTFAMAVLAGIGNMPDTITDRAVNIAMRRRASGERVAQFRSRRDGPKLEKLRDSLARWASNHVDQLTAAEPDMPVEDRAADTWEPLIAVADAAGGHWPRTARDACRALVDQAVASDEDASLDTRLLADIRTTFAERMRAFLPTSDLLQSLRTLDESPWGEAHSIHELTARKLAMRLKPFGVRSERDTTGSVRGYRLDAFRDAFERYLGGDPSESVKPSETATMQAQQSDGSQPSDTSKRQTHSSVRNETPGQRPYLTGLTDDDASPPVTCQSCGEPIPASLSSACARRMCTRCAARPTANQTRRAT